MNKTKINWCDVSWNPITGCSKIARGCKNCYAEEIAKRFWGNRKFTDVQFHPERLNDPKLRSKKPLKIFVNSMSDLYHENILMEQIREVYQIMINYPQHTYLVLTKRIERAHRLHPQILTELFGNDLITNLPNFWLGYSASTQQEIFDMEKYSKNTVVNWISIEPQLQEIFDIDTDWCVIGCESGNKRRPFYNSWVKTLIDRHHWIPFWIKQIRDEKNNVIEDMNLFPKELQLREYPNV